MVSICLFMCMYLIVCVCVRARVKENESDLGNPLLVGKSGGVGGWGFKERSGRQISFDIIALLREYSLLLLSRRLSVFHSLVL